MAYVRLQRRHRRRQLHGDGGDKLARTGEVAATAREEEAGAEQLLDGALVRDRASDGRLARAGEAVEPENVARVVRFGPRHDVLEEGHTRAGVAKRVVPQRVAVLALVRVELGAARIRQRVERNEIIIAAIFTGAWFDRN